MRNRSEGLVDPSERLLLTRIGIPPRETYLPPDRRVLATIMRLDRIESIDQPLCQGELPEHARVHHLPAQGLCFAEIRWISSCANQVRELFQVLLDIGVGEGFLAILVVKSVRVGKERVEEAKD